MINKITDELFLKGDTSDENLLYLLDFKGDKTYLFNKANEKKQSVYGDEVYIRGLIEISNYCKNNCLYCGIRKDNKNVKRYRLLKEDILNCAHIGYKLGFRTFVLQGGEDIYYSDEVLTDIIKEIKSFYKDIAITLSLGERSFESYKVLKEAGADRYLLRHETIDDKHYKMLHPEKMSLENRVKCLYDLKELGYQVGSGIMVGSPYQTDEHIIKDIRFLQKLNPHMIGIGTFITHKDTPFKDEKNGDIEKTLTLISILRLMFPLSLIPATTALASIDKTARIKALSSGANVVMPNLSPGEVRKNYALYDNKAYSGSEGAESLNILKAEIEKANQKVSVSRGDSKLH